jgi:hypothetical protein
LSRSGARRKVFVGKGERESIGRRLRGIERERIGEQRMKKYGWDLKETNQELQYTRYRWSGVEDLMLKNTNI